MYAAEIIRKYLEIILNWPFLGAVLIFWFIIIFKSEVRALLGRLIRIGGTEFEGTGQAEIKGMVTKTELSTKKPEKEPSWEFRFYEKAVANSTARSLAWLHKTGSSTKPYFYENMTYPPDTSNMSAEKEAQFSTMLNYKFIEPEGELFKVTKKGHDFLKYFKFI
ncbi:MAG TPA: hypothetical protein VK675_04830 [Candidatus Paceibacterota bacterium]|nr:hypothetical protein [Candidatus Paceibacterota bacterium]